MTDSQIRTLGTFVDRVETQISRLAYAQETMARMARPSVFKAAPCPACGCSLVKFNGDACPVCQRKINE